MGVVPRITQKLTLLFALRFVGFWANKIEETDMWGITTVLQ